MAVTSQCTLPRDSKPRVSSGEAIHHERAEKVLVANSNADTMEDALLEWYVEDHMLDAQECILTCGLRGTGPSQYMLNLLHKDGDRSGLLINVSTAIRYVFPIRLLSSRGICYLDTQQDVRRHYNSQIRALRCRAHFEEFLTLVSENGDQIQYADLFGTDPAGPLRPELLLEIRRYMARHHREFPVDIFRVNLESPRNIKTFQSLAIWDRQEIWPALTAAQQTHLTASGLCRSPDYEMAVLARLSRSSAC